MNRAEVNYVDIYKLDKEIIEYNQKSRNLSIVIAYFNIFDSWIQEEEIKVMWI